MAIIDWYSWKVLSWQVFNTMDAGRYARLLRDTIEQYGCSAVFNTDQGAQFTSDVFTSVLIEYGIEISMDGRGRALDNIRIERLWRSLKYEGLFSAAKIARLKNTRVYLTANIVDYMCAIAYQCNSLRELIFSQLLHFNEDIYLKCYETMEELKEGIRYYFNYYNSMRLYQGLDYEVPDDMYQSFQSEKPDRNTVA